MTVIQDAVISQVGRSEQKMFGSFRPSCDITSPYITSSTASILWEKQKFHSLCRHYSWNDNVRVLRKKAVNKQLVLVSDGQHCWPTADLGHLPGTEVPKATKAMAFTVSFKKMKHPKCEATSPMTAVIKPIIRIDATNVKYPPWRPIRNGTLEQKSRKCHQFLKNLQKISIKYENILMLYFVSNVLEIRCDFY